MTHERVEVGDRIAGYRLEVGMPFRLPGDDPRRFVIDARVNSFQIPTRGKEAVHQGTGNRAEEIHGEFFLKLSADSREVGRTL